MLTLDLFYVCRQFLLTVDLFYVCRHSIFPFSLAYRVLLLGTSKQPFDCEMKGLASTFQKIVLLPRPDYASRNGKDVSSYYYFDILNLTSIKNQKQISDITNIDVI